MLVLLKLLLLILKVSPHQLLVILNESLSYAIAWPLFVEGRLLIGRVLSLNHVAHKLARV